MNLYFMQMELNLINFLTLSYEELEKRNLENKKDRKENKSQEYFRKKAIKYLEEEKGIKAVNLCFTDLEGKFLNLDYDKNFLLNSEDNLTFDGSSIKGFSTQNKSDLRLKVDWSSFRWLPSDVFGPGKIMVFADVYTQEGKAYDSDFRSRLKSLAEELFRNEKYEINVAPEIEGFLFKGINAEQTFNSMDGFELVTKGGYYNSLPQDTLRQFIDKVAEVKRAMGFENEKDHPEVAPSQFELNYKYCDVVQAADQIQIYKLICRQVAAKMGCTASFLPKPVMNINGSGMHTNISLSKDGINLFYSKDKEISEIGLKFATGILANAKDLCLIINSSVNAYRRLDPHFEAPNEIKMSTSDRGSMIRIPIGNEKSSRIEVRSVAPDCNPYMSLFAMIKLGLIGAKEKTDKFKSILSKREKLPGNIYDALRYFKSSKLIAEILGKESHEKFIDLKECVANRSPKELGKIIKTAEIIYHHEVTNQSIWSRF